VNRPDLHSGGDRRREARHEVMLDAKLRVPLTPAGSAILVANSTIENLSRDGAYVYIRALRKGHEQALADACRKCALTSQLPGREVPLFLSGRIAWIDVRIDDPRSSARLGIQLTETAPEELERLTQFLNGLAARG